MRKVMCVFFAFLLLFSLSVSAFAAVQAEQCERCNIGTIRKTRTVYGEWREYDSDTCSHGDPFHYTDILERRTETAIYKCDNCVYSYELDLGYQYRTHCLYKGVYYYN